MTKNRKRPVQKQAPSRFRLQFDFDYKGTEGRKMDPESETQPDMSLTVRQLLQNHTRGIDSNVQMKEPLYFEVPVPVVTDITDVYEYRAALQERIKATNEFIENELDEAQRAQAKEDLEKKQNVDSNGQTSIPLEEVVLEPTEQKPLA